MLHRNCLRTRRDKWRRKSVTISFHIDVYYCTPTSRCYRNVVDFVSVEEKSKIQPHCLQVTLHSDW